MARLNILNVDDTIAAHIRKHGPSARGNQYFEVGYLLDQAGLLGHLLAMVDNGVVDRLGTVETLRRVADFSAGLEGPRTDVDEITTEKEPPPEPVDNEPPPRFGAL